MNNHKMVLAGAMLVTLCGCKLPGQGTAVNEYTVLETVKVDATEVEFYIDLGTDSAILGFMVEDDSGKPRYFPMYASTYRGLPSVTLDVFVSNEKDAMWVRSSWKGYENLAVHELGTDTCLTRYGKISSFDEPTPETLGGGSGVFPEIDEGKVTKVARLTHVSKSP
jgi:hypothetical protein